MPEQKVVAVYGAIGAQGRSVVQALLRDKSGSFTIRALTRSPDSATATEFAKAGVEVVKADGFKRDELLKAFDGAWAAFINTNSDDPVFEDSNGPDELDLGRIVVDAAASAGVKHVVYSGMKSTKEITGGALEAEAFEQKHAIGEYAKSKAVFETVSIVSIGCYLENHQNPELDPVFGGFPSIPNEEGVLVLRVPKWGGKEAIPFVSIKDDFGDIVHGILLRPDAWGGKFVQAVSETGSWDDLVRAFTQATGKKAVYEPLPSWEAFETYGVKALETVKQMFRTVEFMAGRYFGDETENTTAGTLKREAAAAQGKQGEDGELMSLEKWFANEFGGKGSG